jgi:hypothetical protein
MLHQLIKVAALKVVLALLLGFALKVVLALPLGFALCPFKLPPLRVALALLLGFALRPFKLPRQRAAPALLPGWPWAATSNSSPIEGANHVDYFSNA